MPESPLAGGEVRVGVVLKRSCCVVGGRCGSGSSTPIRGRVVGEGGLHLGRQRRGRVSSAKRGYFAGTRGRLPAPLFLAHRPPLTPPHISSYIVVVLGDLAVGAAVARARLARLPWSGGKIGIRWTWRISGDTAFGRAGAGARKAKPPGGEEARTWRHVRQGRARRGGRKKQSP